MRGIKKTKRAEVIIELINSLDYAYEMHPNKSYIQGMIMGLATSIYGDCDKPKCISDKLWNNLLKHSKTELDANEELFRRREAFSEPKDIREALGYEIPEEVDARVLDWEV